MGIHSLYLHGLLRNKKIPEKSKEYWRWTDIEEVKNAFDQCWRYRCSYMYRTVKWKQATLVRRQ